MVTSCLCTSDGHSEEGVTICPAESLELIPSATDDVMGGTSMTFLYNINLV